MYGLAVNLIVSVSGHPWIINEITKSPESPQEARKENWFMKNWALLTYPLDRRYTKKQKRKC